MIEQMIVSSMASSSATTTITSLWSSPSSLIRRKDRATLCAPLSACVIFHAKSQNFYSFRWNPQPGLSLLSSWNGLKRHLGVSIPKQYAKTERKGNCKRREGVYASLFGVGAPEALVIGVVALLVFGPKGLAEVARNLGKTLRAFQPTIRELQDVSREFKSTLEREIGLDDFQNPTQQQQQKTIYTSSSNPNTSSDPNGVQAYSSEEYLKITEEQLKASSASATEQQQQQIENTPTTLESNLSDPPTMAQNDTTQAAAVLTTNPTPKQEN